MGIENVDGEDPKGCTEATCCEAVERWIYMRLGFGFGNVRIIEGFCYFMSVSWVFGQLSLYINLPDSSPEA